MHVAIIVTDASAMSQIKRSTESSTRLLARWKETLIGQGHQHVNQVQLTDIRGEEFGVVNSLHDGDSSGTI
jgi:hypothetical protein